jgi:hypothetical protein
LRARPLASELAGFSFWPSVSASLGPEVDQLLEGCPASATRPDVPTSGPIVLAMASTVLKQHREHAAIGAGGFLSHDATEAVILSVRLLLTELPAVNVSWSAVLEYHFSASEMSDALAETARPTPPLTLAP